MFPENSQVWRSRILIALGIGTVLLLYLHDHFGLPALFLYGALALSGLLVIALGLDDIIAREAPPDAEFDQLESYSGFRSVLWGLFLVLLGLCIIAAGMILFVGAGDTVVDFLKARPGPALIIAGAFLITYSLATVISPVDKRGSFWNHLAIIPGRLFNLALAVLGILILAAGFWDVIAPAAFNGSVTHVFNTLLRIPQ
jgi:hypothetical protein